MKKDLLLIIDMQNVYASGGAWCCPGAENAAAKIRDLISSSGEELDVIFTRFIANRNPKGTWREYNIEYSDINNDDHSNAMMDIFGEELKKYPLYTKSVYSSMDIPEVRDAVRKAGRVLIAGVVAECCVLSTALAVIDSGAYVVYLRDCVAGLNRQTEEAVETVLSGLEPIQTLVTDVHGYLSLKKIAESGEEHGSKPRILGVGVATMDIYPDKKRMYPGGNEYNVACNASILGGEAGFLGVFGDDLAGEILENTLIKLNVDTGMCHHERGSSGYSLVRLKDDGDRVFLDWNRQGVTDLHPIRFTPEEIAYVRSFDAVSMGRVADVEPASIRMLREKYDIDICYDFHAVFTDADINAIAPYIKYGFFSCSHLKEDDIRTVLKKTVDRGCRIAIGTRGCDPVMAYDGKQYYIHEVNRVEATDALGAGDSFIGAFLMDYISGKGEDISEEALLRRALKAAADYAATVVVKEGSVGIGYDFDPPAFDQVVNVG